jgi:hypothetical protein
MFTEIENRYLRSHRHGRLAGIGPTARSRSVSTDDEIE